MLTVGRLNRLSLTRVLKLFHVVIGIGIRVLIRDFRPRDPSQIERLVITRRACRRVSRVSHSRWTVTLPAISTSSLGGTVIKYADPAYSKYLMTVSDARTRLLDELSLA